MDLSIVTTLYYSSAYLPEFYDRISQEVQKITNNYEIIFVNDGSPDRSLEIVLSFYEQDSRVKIIDLSRNFGHHKAIVTGLSYARGELIFLIDCDLEEEPELLSKFYHCYQNSDADVVYGIQSVRKGNLFEKITGEIFYKVFNWFSSYPIPSNLLTIRILSQRYVKALVSHREREIFLAGIAAITGFKQVPLLVNKFSKGSSTYNIGRKLSLFVNSVTSFSNKPLILVFYLGTIISLLAILAAIYLIFKKVFFGALLLGWPSLIVSIWFLGGLNIFCIGLIGIYLSKVFTETKQRPYTIIRKIYEYSEASFNLDLKR